MSHLLAASYLLPTLNGIGPLGSTIFQNPTQGSSLAAARLTSTLSIVLGVITIISGIWFMVQLVMGAFQWISAGSDKQNLQTAKKRITNAIIGLFIVVISYSVMALVGYILGFDIINLNNLIISIYPQ